jgi:hypothetical protein
LIDTYYVYSDQRAAIIAGNNSETAKFLGHCTKKLTPKSELKFCEEFCQQYSSELIKIFMDAINNRNPQTIMEIAAAIDFFKSFDGKVADRYRFEILMTKKIWDMFGKKLSIGDLAKEIKWPKSDSTDGLSQLRRMCIELKFPLAKSKTKTNKQK